MFGLVHLLNKGGERVLHFNCNFREERNSLDSQRQHNLIYAAFKQTFGETFTK